MNHFLGDLFLVLLFGFVFIRFWFVWFPWRYFQGWG